MRNIWLIIKNNFYRLSKEKVILFMIIVILPIIVYFGVFFSRADNLKGKIAVVGANVQQEQYFKKAFVNYENITLVFLKEKATKTELIRGIYLSEIVINDDDMKVISYGNEEIRKLIEASINGEVYEGKKNITTMEGRIIGFLTMFLLLGGSMMVDFFLTDRENKTYTRVLSSGISYYQYIIGQILYSIIALTVTTIVMTLLVIKILSVQLTISIGFFSFLIFLIGILSTSFSILVCTLCKSKASAPMVMSAIIMITSLFGGCIINIVDENKIIEVVRNLIPQKRLIDLANSYNDGALIYLIAIIIIFILVSIFIGKKQCDRGEFV